MIQLYHARIDMSSRSKNEVGFSRFCIMNFLAYVFVLMKGIVYGTTPFFTIELSHSCDTLDILALRFLLSLCVMWVLKSFKIIKVSVGVRDILLCTERRPFMKSLLLTAIFEPVLYMFFETAGISMTNGITTAVVLSLSPVISCACEMIFFKEHPTHLQAVFLGLGMFGAIYIAVNTGSSEGKSSIVGILFIILAMLCGSLFFVFSRKSSSHFSSMEITYISCILGAVAFNSVNIVRHLVAGDILHYFDPYFSLGNLVGFIVLGVFSTIVATSMNNYAISKLSITTMAAFGGVSTIVTVLVGVIFGGESIEVYHLIGFSFILARMIGVSAVSIAREKKAKKKPAAEVSTADSTA